MTEPPGSSQLSDDSLFASVSCCTLQSSSSTGFLTVSFTNLTGGNLGGELHRGAAANALSAAVPEPETYAMMVAGLGLLTFMLRRRARRT